MTDVDAMLDSLADDIDSLPDERKDLLMGKIEGHKTFTVPEVAELLALSETTVRRKLRDGEISGVQTGNGWRVSRADLEAWWGEHGGGALFDDGSERDDDVGGGTIDITGDIPEDWPYNTEHDDTSDLYKVMPTERGIAPDLGAGYIPTPASTPEVEAHDWGIFFEDDVDRPGIHLRMKATVWAEEREPAHRSQCLLKVMSIEAYWDMVGGGEHTTMLAKSTRDDGPVPWTDEAIGALEGALMDFAQNTRASEEGERRYGYTLTADSKENWSGIADESGVDALRDLQPGGRVNCQPLGRGGWLLVQLSPENGTGDMIGGEVLAKVPPEESEYFDSKTQTLEDW